MTLESYLRKKEERLISGIFHRVHCPQCRKPKITCYCAAIRPFESSPIFAILMHRSETRKRIATGRMAHLCLKNSYLFEGVDFTDHQEVNALIADPRNYCVVLSPGANAVNLSKQLPEARAEVFPAGRRPVIFVIDGTWSQARRMKRLSKNLSKLPAICFTPIAPSGFSSVRRQPAEYCYSTIEAIHETLSLLGATGTEHNNLITVFSFMVRQQHSYVEAYAPARGGRAMRGKR